MGALPEAILSRTVEITREEAESLVTAWQARARAVQQELAAAKPASAPRPTTGPAQSVPAPPAPAPKPAAERLTRYGPIASPRSGRSRRPLFISIAVVVVLVAVVVGVLAMTGRLGIGASGPGTSSSASTTHPASNETVAKVGGQKISRAQLDQKIADFEAQYPGQVPDKTTAPEQYKQFEEGVLDYLITYQLVSRKAKALGIAVTDQEVDSEMALILDSTYSGDQTKFDAAIRAQGLTLERFKQIYGESMLFNKVYAEVTNGVTVAGNDSAALEAKQKQTWSAWVAKQMKTVGVDYADGWAAPTGTETTASR